MARFRLLGWQLDFYLFTIYTGDCFLLSIIHSRFCFHATMCKLQFLDSQGILQAGVPRGKASLLCGLPAGHPLPVLLCASAHSQAHPCSCPQMLPVRHNAGPSSHTPPQLAPPCQILRCISNSAWGLSTLTSFRLQRLSQEAAEDP